MATQKSMDVYSWQTPPNPPGAADQKRVAEQSKRRMIMDGIWERLLRAHAISQIGRKRTRMAGLVDISSNLLLQFVTQIATLYRRPPKITHDDSAGLERMDEQLKASKTWGLAKRNQQRTVGLREHIMVVGWKGGQPIDGGRLVVRAVSPDFTWGVEHENDSTQFGVFYEARERSVMVERDEDGNERWETVWTWDRWDVLDPDPLAPEGSNEATRPNFTIWDETLKKDWTDQFVEREEWAGDSYPYRREDGVPIVPAILYHASPHQGLWAFHEMKEVIFGTLQDALNWTQVNHGFKIGSFAQRYIAGGRIKGGTVKEIGGGDKVEVIIADPAVALEISSDGDGQVNVGQWGPAVDIQKAEAFARSYGGRLAVHFGLSPADVTFDSRSPASGVSLTVSRQGQREKQADLAPQFREGDEQLLLTIAVVLDVWGVKVPESGYGIEYAAIELAPSERMEILTNVREELEMGLTTKVDAWMRLHPGSTESEAKKALKSVNKEIKKEQESQAPEPAEEPAEVSPETIPEGPVAPGEGAEAEGSETRSS